MSALLKRTSPACRTPHFGLLWRGMGHLGVFVLTLVLGCKSPGTSTYVTEISAAALHDSLSANPNLMLVDVRTSAEWEMVRVRGVKKFIEHNQIANRVAELGADTSTQIYLICRSGHRSRLAAETLAKLGYRHLLSIEGGTNAWIAAGFPADSGRVPDGNR